MGGIGKVALHSLGPHTEGGGALLLLAVRAPPPLTVHTCWRTTTTKKKKALAETGGGGMQRAQALAKSIVSRVITTYARLLRFCGGL